VKCLATGEVAHSELATGWVRTSRTMYCPLLTKRKGGSGNGLKMRLKWALAAPLSFVG